MNTYFSLIFILVFGLISIIISVRMILIGKNIIKHPMYDNEEKKKYVLKMGIISIIPLIICELFIITTFFSIVLG